MVEYDHGHFRLGNLISLERSLVRNSENGATEVTESDIALSYGEKVLDARSLWSADFRILTLQQQLDLLKHRYANPLLLQQPLLPPYTWLQISAIEAEHNIRFPAILRLYMKQISRQQAISFNRSCFLTGYENGWLQFEESSSKLRLRGPMRGFICSPEWEEDWLSGTPDWLCWQTVFERLLHPNIYDGSCPLQPLTDSHTGQRYSTPIRMSKVSLNAQSW